MTSRGTAANDVTARKTIRSANATDRIGAPPGRSHCFIGGATLTQRAACAPRPSMWRFDSEIYTPSVALQKRRDALTRLVRLERAELVLALQLDLRAEGVSAGGGEGVLDVCDQRGRCGRNRARQFLRLARELLGGDDAVDEADRPRLLRRDHPPGRHHLERAARAGAG